ncbi:MarR family winged helix-turn-helix transcriptional regulator [Pendulispora albinea]|uniref:MarR family transcriptional regulator n=1 Tax=Pendulispora albinea TaxID=2741071 RepID=A0ABZ2LRU0_9BACT
MSKDVKHPRKDLVAAVAASWKERFPEWDVSGLTLSMRLGHIAREQLARYEEMMERYGLGPSGFPALAIVASAGEGGLTPSQLMDQMNCPSGTVTHRLNLMERAGLIRREVDASDRRSLRIHITAFGLERLHACADEYFTLVREPFAKLTRAEREMLDSLLRKAGGGLLASDGRSRKG